MRIDQELTGSLRSPVGVEPPQGLPWEATAEALAERLKDHPGVETFTRGRDGACAEGGGPRGSGSHAGG